MAKTEEACDLLAREQGVALQALDVTNTPIQELPYRAIGLITRKHGAGCLGV